MDELVSSSEIGGKMKGLRQKAGLTQEGLAELVGVTFQQIQKYENGKTTLNILMLQHIAKALKVPASDFFSSASAPQISISTDEERLLRLFRNIKSAQLKRCVLMLVENLNKRPRSSM